MRDKDPPTALGPASILAALGQDPAAEGRVASVNLNVAGATPLTAGWCKLSKPVLKAPGSSA